MLWHRRRARRSWWNSSFTFPLLVQDHPAYKMMLVSRMRPFHMRAAVQRGIDEWGTEVDWDVPVVLQGFEEQSRLTFIFAIRQSFMRCLYRRRPFSPPSDTWNLST